VTSASDRLSASTDPELASVVRRAPFADSPFVGERGQRARQRIVDAALQLFGELGYHGCGIKRITELSGCSRAAFYQYFSSKEDLFRQLSGRVARLLADATDDLAPITADRTGYQTLRSWLDRYSEIYDEYAPVFETFESAAASDEAVASGGARVAVRTFAGLKDRVEGTRLPARHLDGVIRAFPETAARANGVGKLLHPAGVDGGVSGGRTNQAIADVFHRTLFAPDEGVNVHAPPRGRRKAARVVDVTAADEAARELRGDPSLGPAAQRTRAQLLEAGHRVFAEKGYYATRVTDVVQAAGVSHGIFYRYFDNKTHLFRLLAERASAELTAALDRVPTLAGPGVGEHASSDLRAWLADYAATSAEEAAIRAMWNEAMSRDPRLGAVSAAATEQYRRTCAALLAPRGFGDADAEAVVLMVLLDGMTAPRPTPSRLETAAQVIERGLLAEPA
jgi:AcrR family transcriptional regulator